MKPFFNFSFDNPFKSEKYIILADKEPLRLNDNQIVDVVLSPKYYWVKKETLPLKYEYQAKKYAPSSFDGVIPDGHYSYLAKKGDDCFWMYAYDDSFILKELNKLGLKSSQIRRVFFAQNEFANIQNPISANRNEALTNHDGFVIKVPNSLALDCVDVKDFFAKNKLSNFYVNLNKFNKIIDFKKAYIISALLLLLVIFYGFELFGLKKVQKDQESQRERISKMYKMPQTSIQTKALIKRFDKKLNSQKTLRENFYHVTKTPLLQKEYFSLISLDGKKMILNIQGLGESRIQVVDKHLKRHLKVKNMKKNGNSVIFEVEL